LLVEGPVQELVLGQGSLVLEVSSPRRAAKLLKTHLNVTVVEEDFNYLNTNLKREQVPEAVRLLVNGDIDVFGVTSQKASLEDYFLSITAGEGRNAEPSMSAV
jgi:ABC-2 type transport system ATP-binding protein